MTTHSRSQSKGSFSIFSIDTFRSLSRSGSRAASRARQTDVLDDLTRSPSALSRCDPNAQLPPSPIVDRISSGRGKKDPCHLRTANDQTTPETQGTAADAKNIFSSTLSPGKRRRPFSWNLLRTPAYNLKKRRMSVQLPNDMSSSTVARNVISAPVLTSTSNVKVAKAEGVHLGELTEETFGMSNWSSKLGWAKDNKTMNTAARNLADKIVREEANTEKPHGRLQRLGEVLKGKFRKQDDFCRMEDGSSLNRKITRRKTEALNLCKGKIKDLTGNGHIQRKSVNDKADKRTNADEDPPLLKKTSYAALTLDDNDSHYGSLSRSFNSAVEKMDLTATTNMSFLRSKSSIFNMKKEDPKPMMIPSLPTTPAKTAAMAVPIEDGQNKDMKQYHYSPNQGGYIPTPSVPGYPGGVDGLRMHGETTAFATSPKDITLPVTSKPCSDRLLDMDDEYTLSVAPIFSPSMGDLSQYSNTPAPKKTRDVQETIPRRSPLLKKNRSSLSLFSKAALSRKDENLPLKKSGSMIFNPIKKETPVSAPPNESPYKPATPSPLRIEAPHGKTSRLARSNKTSRSPQVQAKRFGVIGLPSPAKHDRS